MDDTSGSNIHKASTEGSADGRSSSGRRTIMIVQDNQASTKLLRETLQRMNCRTVEARGGVSALYMLEDMPERPDMLITDIMMPEMDGITLIKWLRHIPRYDSMPIIVLSAFAAEADVQAALDAGASEYLTKPLQIRWFMDMLSDYLNIR